MTRSSPLSPLGTARERLLSGEGPPPVFPDELGRVLSDFNLGEEAAFLAWELARCVTGLEPDEQHAVFLLGLASIVNLHQGSTRLPVRGPSAVFLDKLCATLGAPGTRAVVEGLLDDPRLATILGAPGQYKPLLLEGDFLYHQRTLHVEERLVSALSARLRREPFAFAPGEVARALAEVRAQAPGGPRGPVELSAEQEYAALTAVYSPLAVITGGPGTGKTSIVVTILRLLVRLGVPISGVALAAPTGKAANRIKGAIQAALAALGELDERDREVASVPEPRTLHRLLGYSPGKDRFLHHAQHRLPERVVIVDECSMIDLFLMHQLVHAVRDDATLVLLGDAEQLPSVDAGAVFRSLLPPGTGACSMPWRELVRASRVGALPAARAEGAQDLRWRASVRLSHSYRMDSEREEGRNILGVATLMNEGRAGELLPPAGEPPGPSQIALRASAAAVEFRKVELLPNPGGRRRGAFLARWLDERVLGHEEFEPLTRRVYTRTAGAFSAEDARALDLLLTHIESLRILCVTRLDREGNGADAINEQLHAAMLRRAGAEGGELCLGEPVMMQHNDYDRDLFNGDQGLVLAVEEGRAATRSAVFRRGAGEFVVFPVEALRGEIKLSYAMTVHKAQGSEFEHVALVLPSENLPLFTREVLYTAVSRSKSSVVIVGDQGLLEAGVRQPIERFSGIAEKLARS